MTATVSPTSADIDAVLLSHASGVVLPAALDRMKSRPPENVESWHAPDPEPDDLVNFPKPVSVKV